MWARAGFTFAGWVNPTTLSQTLPFVEYDDIDNLGNGLAQGVYFYVSDPFDPSGPGQLFADIVDTGGNDHFIISPPNLVTTNSLAVCGFDL